MLDAYAKIKIVGPESEARSHQVKSTETQQCGEYNMTKKEFGGFNLLNKWDFIKMAPGVYACKRSPGLKWAGSGLGWIKIFRGGC